MDEIDKKITLLLQEDARMTITEMTEHLHSAVLVSQKD